MNSLEYSAGKDINFKLKCLKHGIKLGNYKIINDLIVLFNEDNDICMVLDKNYKIVAVENKYNIKTAINDYYNKKINIGNHINLSVTLKQIIDISSKLQVKETNKGHTLSYIINGRLYHDNGSEYFALLSYIKFFADIIEIYFSQVYHMKCKQLEVLDIYEYINKCSEQIYSCVEFCIKSGEKPLPFDIIEWLGSNLKELNNQRLIFSMIELVLKISGYKSTPGTLNKIEKYNTELNLEENFKKVLKIIDDKGTARKEESAKQKIIGKLK